MTTDLWHYPRTELASQVLGMFETGLSSALVFFAPRRMGKTEFLLKDVQPLANKKSWKTFYFSFLDTDAHAGEQFAKAIATFVSKNGIINKTAGAIKHVKKIGGEISGIGKAEIEFKNMNAYRYSLKEIMDYLAKKGKVLLLMDEIQVLADYPENEKFLATLRTALDIHKDSIKVIFTGSSQGGLRRMFSEKAAPFFHFGQNLSFPEFHKEFTNHLASVYKKVTGQELNVSELWIAFKKLGKIPQLIRSLVERIALNPELMIKKATNELLTHIYDEREFVKNWNACSPLGRLILEEIASGNKILFSNDVRKKFAKQLNVSQIAISSIQSTVRTLQKRKIIGKAGERASYYIDDPNYKDWLEQMQKN
jgi:uncharacterized protein